MTFEHGLRESNGFKLNTNCTNLTFSLSRTQWANHEVFALC